ncbi:type IV toxin-antitoxin system AbiEi family antitoxin domain-containing protein [Halorussus salilacus]|uniref:type IV toxin-antitoxin system AbiEi family antitoxin domain-containing protein n=1 Tax=Halorussus salilacus TaxID=2953750 RepID=UPI00209EFC8E|nr:type IV toxin-antitoxin system AbiEi family antitoxin domain-containing protein [Halorussus salilacus]USZ69191.1 type IV toxin-antitoxin system AbiEi family antitoxin domain-containing protein [Halorussus salilacus]
MVEFKTPMVDHPPSEIEGIEEGKWTLITVSEDCELTDKQWNQLTHGTIRQHNRDTGQGENLRPIKSTEPSPEGDHIGWIKLNISDLYKVLYEHKRYSSAKGFSNSEMDVLRAIEETRENRVMLQDFKHDFRVEDYAESTIYNALNGLVEKELLERVGRGVYRYTGP